MWNSKKTIRHRVPAREAATYRSAAENQGVPELVASLVNIADDYRALEACGQADSARGAAEAHYNIGLILAATPATSPLEAKMKIVALGCFAEPNLPNGEPPHAAMIAEAIRHEREIWQPSGSNGR